jgi:chromosome segregation ATPase
MANEWVDAKKQALKILGDKGKLPDDKPLDKGFDAAEKAIGEFRKSRDDLEAKIAELQGQLEKYSSTCDQLEARLEKSGLGLDEKNKDEAKQIAQARGILCDALSVISKACEDDIKVFKEVARHVILGGKYKPSATSA